MTRIALPALLLGLSVLFGCGDGAEPPAKNSSSHDLQDDEPEQADDDDGSCASSGECAPGAYCAFSDGACGAGVGFCKELDTGCPTIAYPICGCDGLTYDNGCRAGEVGISVAHGGACPETGSSTGEPPPPVPGCGGVECSEAEYCEWADGSCGEAGGAGGVCVLVGGPCTGKYEPVCGCNGETYNTKCDAKMIGVALRHMGPC